MNPKVEKYYSEAREWGEELRLLRLLVLECGLVEEYKWRIPVYTSQGKNVVGLSPFRKACALTFFKGVLLRDSAKMLKRPGEHSQAGRFMRFSSVEEIHASRELITTYIYEAIECERAGLKVAYKGVEEYEFPDELATIFEEVPELQLAFEALSPGRQKGYLLHFSGAKQSATRLQRIERSKFRIMEGFGLRDCVCGMSSRLPACDGSHKNLK